MFTGPAGPGVTDLLKSGRSAVLLPAVQHTAGVACECLYLLLPAEGMRLLA